MTNSLLAGLPPVHPGEVLREDVLPAVKAKKIEIAEALGITRQALDNLLKGKTALSPVNALKLERLFGGSAEMWCNLQRDYDLATARQQNAEELKSLRLLDAA
jgi:addiction module HigA family antidote